jgi:rod shape-determining protein MreC
MSLASGTNGNVLSRTVSKGVSIVAFPFWQAMSAVQNRVEYVTSFFVAYSASRTEAENLRRENAALVPRIADRDALEAENERLRELLKFEKDQHRLSLTPASVRPVSDSPLAAGIISNTTGVLVINRGSIHGVEEAMCAMTKDGVVGIVIKVEPTLAYVASLHSEYCKIGAMISRDKRVRATVHGSGSDYSPICRMEYIDTQHIVRTGDEVLTSGSGIFPSEYPIGKIIEVEKGGSLFQAAFIQPYADPYAVDELFLVRRAQPTLAELTGTASAASDAGVEIPPPVDDDQGKKTASNARNTGPFAMPDTRSVQERYAP